MYLNEITLKCGRVLAFTATVPYSIDKMAEGLNVVAAENGVTVSFIGAEVVAVVNSRLDPKTTGKHVRGSKFRIEK